MKIYITGVSGTGKTSIARALITRGINAVDIDEISHWENKASHERVALEEGASDEWHNAHGWFCDLEKLKEVLGQSKNSVAVGHAENQSEYLPFFDKVFVLHCKPETIVSRINSRTDNDFGKHPAEQVRILEWQKGFTDWMVAKGASVLDGELPLEELVANIEAILSTHERVVA